MSRKKSLIPGFSLNRALGITAAKQRIARATGIPTTKAGRKRKMQRHLWTAVAAGTCAAVSNSDTAQQKDNSAQKVRERPLWIRVLAIVCFAFILIGAISNLLKRVPHVSKEPSGERLNTSNVEEYAPDLKLTQENQSASADTVTPDTGDLYYTEEEQAEAAAAYYESIGGNPYAEEEIESDATEDTSDQAAHSYILNTNTKVFHTHGCSSADRIKDKNRSTATGTRDEMISKGYSPCGKCHP